MGGLGTGAEGDGNTHNAHATRHEVCGRKAEFIHVCSGKRAPGVMWLWGLGSRFLTEFRV